MSKCQKDGKKRTDKQVLHPDAFDNIVRLNEGQRVLRTLRGSPAYWENAKNDVFVMIRQLRYQHGFVNFQPQKQKGTVCLKF